MFVLFVVIAVVAGVVAIGALAASVVMYVMPEPSPIANPLDRWQFAAALLPCAAAVAIAVFAVRAAIRRSGRRGAD
jgi:hypothetical protein